MYVGGHKAQQIAADEYFLYAADRPSEKDRQNKVIGHRLLSKHKGV